MPMTSPSCARLRSCPSTVSYTNPSACCPNRAVRAGNYRAYTERISAGCARSAHTGMPAGTRRHPPPSSTLRIPPPPPSAPAPGRMSAGIERFAEHQRAIARLLKSTDQLRRIPMLRRRSGRHQSAAGFTKDDMHRWHAEFEKSAPRTSGVPRVPAHSGTGSEGHSRVEPRTGNKGLAKACSTRFALRNERC